MKKVVMFFICLFAVFTGFSQNRYVGNICIPYDEAKQDYGYTIIDTISQASDSSMGRKLFRCYDAILSSISKSLLIIYDLYKP